MTDFSTLPLSPALQPGLDALGYTTLTPVQAQSLPAILDGRDVIAQAPTGSGKTAAFGLGLLQAIDPSLIRVQALVLCPTRELADQVGKQIRKLATGIPNLKLLLLVGGVPLGPQLASLEGHDPHVVVGTPGRVIDHLDRSTLDLSELKTLVLDEADEMLRMGFIDDVEAVLKKLPEQRQVALFSATMPPQIRRIAQTYLQDPVEVTIAAKTTTSANIRQRYWWVSGMHKLDALTRILEVEPFDAMIIFARTKAGTEELASKLQARGLAAAAINGDMQQAQRERTIAMLKDGKLDILVATDVAARGLDVERISHVLNYDIPYDTESYVHRIGRTGRAGRSGEAILFVTPREKGMLRQIERATRQPIEEMQLPSVDAVNDNRINKFTSRITETLGQGGLDFYRQLLERFETEQNVPAIEVAAALAKMMQGDTPFLLQPPVRAPREERAPRERFERGERPERGDRNERGPRFERGPRRDDAEGGFEQRPRRDVPPRGAPEQGMETYRISVGHQHGVKPANIVGAIANEAGLESRFIGRIDIHDDFSLLDLPAQMPSDVLTHLQKVWVSGQQLQMRPLAAGEEINPAPRPFKPRFDKRGPGGPGGPRRSGPGGPGGDRGGDRDSRPPRRDGFKPRGPRSF